jgi:spermidine synthase
MNGSVEILGREQGACGEVVVRRSGAHVEIIANGAFLMSTANGASSRALVSAALPYLRGRDLHVLIGGLGLGYAVDEALSSPRVAHVTVAELEPVIVRCFRRFGGARAARAADGIREGRLRVEAGDVAGVMAAWPAAFDLIALDTDNGPEWLVRAANAGLYSEAGVRQARDALWPGGAAVFWSPGPCSWFGRRLEAVFDRVDSVVVSDIVQERVHDCTLYIGRRSDPHPG